MTEHEPSRESDLTLLLDVGHPDSSMLYCRVSPDHAEALRECLETENLHVGDVIELSGGEWLQILAVTISAALGARSVIAVAITKFLDRHKDKRVTFGAQGQVETMEGYSTEEVIRVLDTVAQRQRDLDEQWTALLKDSQDDRDQTRPDTED